MADLPQLDLPAVPPRGADKFRQVDMWTRKCKRAIGLVEAWIRQHTDGTPTKSVMLCAAYTPLATGADMAEVSMPYGPAGESLTWNVAKAILRVQTPGGAPGVTVQKSEGPGAFTPVDLVTVTMAGGGYEAVQEGAGTVASGDKLRFSVVALGTAVNWTVIVELTT